MQMFNYPPHRSDGAIGRVYILSEISRDSYTRKDQQQSPYPPVPARHLPNSGISGVIDLARVADIGRRSKVPREPFPWYSSAKTCIKKGGLTVPSRRSPFSQINKLLKVLFEFQYLLFSGFGDWIQSRSIRAVGEDAWHTLCMVGFLRPKNPCLLLYRSLGLRSLAKCDVELYTVVFSDFLPDYHIQWKTLVGSGSSQVCEAFLEQVIQAVSENHRQAWPYILKIKSIRLVEQKLGEMFLVVGRQICRFFLFYFVIKRIYRIQ